MGREHDDARQHDDAPMEAGSALRAEAAIRELAGALAGSANEEGARPLNLSGADAVQAARGIVDDLLAMDHYPRLLERHGLRFICYLADEWESDSPPLVHVQRWDGHQWVNLARVEAR